VFERRIPINIVSFAQVFVLIVGAVDITDEHGTVRVERIPQVVAYGLELLAVSAPRRIKLYKGILTRLARSQLAASRLMTRAKDSTDTMDSVIRKLLSLHVETEI
jgi:hypothetical protein